MCYQKHFHMSFRWPLDQILANFQGLYWIFSSKKQNLKVNKMHTLYSVWCSALWRSQVLCLFFRWSWAKTFFWGLQPTTGSTLLDESRVEPPSGITHRTAQRVSPANATVIDALSSWPHTRIHPSSEERVQKESGEKDGNVSIRTDAEPERRRSLSASCRVR